MHIRMNRSFPVDLGGGRTKTYPAGWVGDAPDKHAEQALADGAAVATEPPEADEELDLDKLTRAELDALAAERGLDISSAQNKGDVLALLKAA